ncbi:MAG: GlcNAc-PI de-N-acetylase [Elusimicrobia bacterium CG08_land_8_20_14_0_20_51_18]|nr:MAG: GlcNAc-PI de-N-acetylase [Elusimicrobia bacterium CG08_land_8_20_14_0_20_51_18]
MKKILAIGPHPDDMEFGCGGTLYKLSKKGFQINLLVMTGGEYGGDCDVRKREQLESAKILKAGIFWGGFRDTEVPMGRELINEIEKNIKKIKPDFIFVNYFNDTHQDHRNVAKAAVTAARYVNNLLFYEVPTTLDFLPNIYKDIGDVLDVKTRLLKCHFSQVRKTKVKNLSIIESAKSAAIFRGYQARVKYAEGFMAQRILLDPVVS